MHLMKFSVLRLPVENSYQVVFPHYPNCITCGDTVEEAIRNAKEAIELLLQAEAEQGVDPVPHNAQVDHVVVGEIQAEVPKSLIEVKQESARAVGSPPPR